MAEEAFDALKAPIKRVAAPDIPVPVSPPLEKFYRPSAKAVVEAVQASMKKA